MVNSRKESTIQSWRLFFPEVKQLIKEKKFFEVRRILNCVHPMDLAEAFRNFEKEEQIIIFRLLNFNRAITVFEDLDVPEQVHLIENLDRNPLEKLIEDMPLDEKTKLIKKLPERVKKKLVSLLKKEELNVVQTTLKFKENTAGSLMNTYFIPLSPNMTTKQAIEKIHALSKYRKFSSLHAFYVINDEGKLIGGISLRKIIAAPSELKISEIMTPVNVIRINVNTELEEVAKLFSKYDIVIAPVIDDDDKLLGVITVDDVIDIINTMTTKQIYSVGKMSAEGGVEIRYETANVSTLVKRRIGWLIFLLAVNFLSGSVLKTFESALATVVALTFFIPMMLDAGGNAGAQTSITIIRGFATGDVSFKNLFRVIKLEFFSAIIMSISVGIIAFFRAYLIGEGFWLALVVGVSMVLLIILAISTGIILPVISKKIGLDPAVLAGPITTTIVDVLGLIIYFKMAQLILPQLRG